MTNQTIVAVDIDDVLVDTSAITIAYYNKAYGTKLTLQDVYSNNPKVWGVKDDATAIARIEAYLETDEFQNVQPREEAVTAISQLGQNYELHIVTGRSSSIERATQGMIDNFFPGIFRSITFTNLFNERKRSKADVCRELGASVLIEDHLGHALPVAAAGIDVLLFGDYPWNQTGTLPANVHRITDWATVLKYFNEQS